MKNIKLYIGLIYPYKKEKINRLNDAIIHLNIIAIIEWQYHS